ncbi:MAG: universal stress protein [Spirosomataceae bacterium]
MKAILFPTDFSDDSAHAVQYAAMLAVRFKSKLILLNVYSIALPVVSVTPMIFDRENLDTFRQNEAERSLQIFTDALIEATQFDYTQIEQIVAYGLVTDAIVDTAKSKDVDFIIMRSQGASSLMDRWFGTNTEKVVEAMACPVWVIPKNIALDVPQVIMYAADFEEDEVTSTFEILALAQPLGASCKVIHIHEYAEEKSELPDKQMAKSLTDTFQHFDVTVKNIRRDAIVQGLETYVRTHKPDVLALAVYEKSFFSKLFSNSLSVHFIQEMKLPLLFFKKTKYV